MTDNLKNNDTIIISANKNGFSKVFLEKNCWYPIRASIAKIQFIKYIAVYQSSPISAITHYAEISSFTPIEHPLMKGMLIANFKQDGAIKLIHPVPKTDKTGGIQRMKYTLLDKILTAETLEDL